MYAKKSFLQYAFLHKVAQLTPSFPNRFHINSDCLVGKPHLI